MFGYGYYGQNLTDQERAEEKRAWLWKRTASGKLVWPGKKYVLIKTFYDSMGRPPIKGLSWERILTPNEYLVYQLSSDSKKKTYTPIGQEFTGR